MTIEQFESTLKEATPPSELSVYLTALWFDGKGDWEQSHHTIQDMENVNGSWIHAYLHRKEGDTANADYWYRRAGRKRPATSFEEEWKELVTAFL